VDAKHLNICRGKKKGNINVEDMVMTVSRTGGIDQVIAVVVMQNETNIADEQRESANHQQKGPQVVQ
jgi:ribosome maturation protein Sdo1